jgi:hypothetical protein
MMSPSTEPVPDFPAALNPRARASLSSGVANFVWMATTGGRVIHYTPKLNTVSWVEDILTEEMPWGTS